VTILNVSMDGGVQQHSDLGYTFMGSGGLRLASGAREPRAERATAAVGRGQALECHWGSSFGSS
jgi:hypothetical protein